MIRSASSLPRSLRPCLHRVVAPSHRILAPDATTPLPYSSPAPCISSIPPAPHHPTTDPPCAASVQTGSRPAADLSTGHSTSHATTRLSTAHPSPSTHSLSFASSAFSLVPACTQTHIPRPLLPATRSLVSDSSAPSLQPQPSSATSPSADAPVPPVKPYDSLFRGAARSLGAGSNARVRAAVRGGVGGVLLRLLGYHSQESQQIRAANALYAAVAGRADDEEFMEAIGLPPCFRTRHALSVLHVWLLLVRLRLEGQAGGAVGQTLYDTFNHDCEKRIVKEGIKLLVSKWMRELEKSFYGAAAAYDAAVAPAASTNALPNALWRNVYAEEASEMPSGPAAAPIQALARYVRRELACLTLTDSDAIMTGNITFSKDFKVAY